MKYHFQAKFEEILTHAKALGKSLDHLAVAFSGGLDSTVLLELCKDYCRPSLTLFAFHIHHNISPKADFWQAHCQEVAYKHGIQYDSLRIRPDLSHYSSLEEAARVARYGALKTLCIRHKVTILICAHHRNDQVETTLLQLLRGSGAPGLSGMTSFDEKHKLLGEIILARPLLNFSRAQLENYAHKHSLEHINDESNFDLRYARNALRHKVLPIIEKYFPGFEKCIVRSAKHAHFEQEILLEVAHEDLKNCATEQGLLISRALKLSRFRQHNLLRYWINQHGQRAPSSAWLEEAVNQLLFAHNECNPCIDHKHYQLRRYRELIVLTFTLPVLTNPINFVWKGQDSIHFPSWKSSLHFTESTNGIDPHWLRTQALRLAPRSGREKLRLALNRPTRDLKRHFQDHAIPIWERTQLPLIYAGNILLFVAKLGCNYHPEIYYSSPGLTLEWRKSPN